MTNLERRISALEQASTSAGSRSWWCWLGWGCPIERVQAGGQVWVRASGEGDVSFLERVAAESWAGAGRCRDHRSPVARFCGAGGWWRLSGLGQRAITRGNAVCTRSAMR